MLAKKHGLLSVDGPDDLPRLREQALGPRAVGADREHAYAGDESVLAAKEPSIHQGRPVRHRGRLHLHAIVVNILGHAHNFAPSIGGADPNPLSESSARIAPDLPRQIFGHHGHMPSCIKVGPGKIAPRDHARSHRLEESRRHHAESADGRDLARCEGLVLGVDRVVRTEERFQRRGVGKRHRGDAWKGRELVQNLLVRSHHALGLVGHRRRGESMQDLNLFRVRESRMDVSQMLKCANHQAGADQ